MRLLSDHDVDALIAPRDAIAAMADAFRRQSLSAMPAPGRLDLGRSDPKGSVLLLAGHSDQATFAMKANMHVYPDPASRERLAASMMLLWDASACRVRALLTTTTFNNHRTAAGLAVAVDRFTPLGVETLTIIGAGKIAPAAIRYLKEVRPFRRITIVGHGPKRASELAERTRRDPAFADCDIRATTDATQATTGADVLVTLTTAATPVFPGRDVKPGALVVLAGANRPDAREADDDLIGRATIIVDHRDGCIQRAGDLVIPLATGRVSSGQIAGEIGALLDAPPPVAAKDGVLVFKSMGVIAQDIALAEMVVARAEALGVGVSFDPTTGECAPAAQRSAAE